MTGKTYQRRHLRAPFKETMIYADDGWVQKASTLNISEGGLLIDELPNFPARDYVPVLLSVPEFPQVRNLSTLRLQTFSKDQLKRSVIRARTRMVRREQLARSLDNIFRSRFGLEFLHVSPEDQKCIDQYVTAFAANLVYLQTLIDSFNVDDETKTRTRLVASILGYGEHEKIALLRQRVGDDYHNLQWG